MSSKKELEETAEIKRLLAKQGIVFNGDKFTMKTVYAGLKYAEQLSKPAKRKRSTGSRHL